jgi:hypothetical protein
MYPLYVMFYVFNLRESSPYAYYESGLILNFKLSKDVDSLDDYLYAFDIQRGTCIVPVHDPSST